MRTQYAHQIVHEINQGQLLDLTVHVEGGSPVKYIYTDTPSNTGGYVAGNPVGVPHIDHTFTARPILWDEHAFYIVKKTICAILMKRGDMEGVNLIIQDATEDRFTPTQLQVLRNIKQTSSKVAQVQDYVSEDEFMKGDGKVGDSSSRGLFAIYLDMLNTGRLMIHMGVDARVQFNRPVTSENYKDTDIARHIDQLRPPLLTVVNGELAPYNPSMGYLKPKTRVIVTGTITPWASKVGVSFRLTSVIVVKPEYSSGGIVNNIVDRNAVEAKLAAAIDLSKINTDFGDAVPPATVSATTQDMTQAVPEGVQSVPTAIPTAVPTAIPTAVPTATPTSVAQPPLPTIPS